MPEPVLPERFVSVAFMLFELTAYKSYLNLLITLLIIFVSLLVSMLIPLDTLETVLFIILLFLMIEKLLLTKKSPPYGLVNHLPLVMVLFVKLLLSELIA